MNLRGAPAWLTPQAVAAIVDDAGAPGLAFVPIVSMKLVDRPRRSEDPRLARANDNSLLPPPGEKIRSGEDGARGAVSGNLPVFEAAPHPFDDGRAL